MATPHAKILALIHKNLNKKHRAKGDKTADIITATFTQTAIPLFKEFESGDYTLKLRRFVTSIEEQKIVRALTLFISEPLSPNVSYFAEHTSLQEIEIVSAKSKSTHLERDLVTPLWRVVEKRFGSNPLGASLHQDLTQNTTWPLVVKDMERAITKNFHPLLAELLADNMREVLYYFIGFSAREDMAGLARLKPVLEVMRDNIMPIGIRHTDNKWSILTG